MKVVNLWLLYLEERSFMSNITINLMTVTASRGRSRQDEGLRSIIPLRNYEDYTVPDLRSLVLSAVRKGG